MKKEKLKICIIQSPQNPHIVRWVEGLTELGHNVKVIPLYQYGLDFMMGSETSNNEKNLFEKIRKHCVWVHQWRIKYREFKPDIVHLHEPMGTLDEYLALHKIPNLVVSVWGTEVSDDTFQASSPIKNYFKKKILTKADCVTATSPFLVECTRKWLKNGDIQVIPFGVDINQFISNDRSEIETNPIPCIGFLKGFMPRYRPDVFIRAMALVNKSIPGVKSVMGGWSLPECKKECMDLAKKLNIIDQIEVFPMLPHKDVPKILKQIDVTVVCSDFESFGVMALESLAAKVPVIVTAVGGLQELIINGITGKIVSPGDYHSIANSIIEILSSPGLKRKMGDEGRCFVEKNYNWIENVKQMEQIYWRLYENQTK